MVESLACDADVDYRMVSSPPTVLYDNGMKMASYVTLPLTLRDFLSNSSPMLSGYIRGLLILPWHITLRKQSFLEGSRRWWPTSLDSGWMKVALGDDHLQGRAARRAHSTKISPQRSPSLLRLLEAPLRPTCKAGFAIK